MCSLRKFAFLTLSASPKASERLYVRFLEMQNYKWERQHSSSSGIFYQEFEHKIVDAVEDSLHIAIGLFEDQQSPRLDIYIQYFMKALGVLLATRKHSCESHMTGKRWECIKAITHVYTYTLYKQTYTHRHTHSIYIHTYVCTYMHTHITYICTYTHTYTRAHTHARTHARTLYSMQVLKECFDYTDDRCGA